MIENSKGYKTFLVFDYFMVALLALICLLPMIHILAVSLSDRVANTAGMVTFWPVNFNLESYRYILKDSAFVRAFVISVLRTVIGAGIQVLMTIMCAYPLSKSSDRFNGRTAYVWFFLIASLFSGGLIPTYLVVKNVHLLNSFWAMIIPCAVPIGNVILMLNFFRGLPKELEEAALLDGAGHLSVLLRVYVPLSKPSIATVTLLHNMVSRTTLNVIMETTDISVIEQLLTVTNESLKSAQLFIGMLPILCVYPFIQKYFTKGLVIGSVKG